MRNIALYSVCLQYYYLFLPTTQVDICPKYIRIENTKIFVDDLVLSLRNRPGVIHFFKSENLVGTISDFFFFNRMLPFLIVTKPIPTKYYFCYELFMVAF